MFTWNKLCQVYNCKVISATTKKKQIRTKQTNKKHINISLCFLYVTSCIYTKSSMILWWAGKPQTHITMVSLKSDCRITHAILHTDAVNLIWCKKQSLWWVPRLACNHVWLWTAITYVGLQSTPVWRSFGLLSHAHVSLCCQCTCAVNSSLEKFWVVWPCSRVCQQYICVQPLCQLQSREVLGSSAMFMYTCVNNICVQSTASGEVLGRLSVSCVCHQCMCAVNCSSAEILGSVAMVMYV